MLPASQVLALDLWHKEYSVAMLRHFGCSSTADVYDGIADPFHTFCANLWDHERNDAVIPVRNHDLAGFHTMKGKGFHPSLLYIDSDWTYDRLRALLDLVFKYDRAMHHWQ